MSLMEPSKILTLQSMHFVFDVESKMVRAEDANGPVASMDHLFAASKNERRVWLESWAKWLDNPQEPLELEETCPGTEMLLRAYFGCARPRAEPIVEWLHTDSIPRSSNVLASLFGRKWLPGQVRVTAASQIHTHRKKMVRWLGDEFERWDEIRSDASKYHDVDLKFDRCLSDLRYNLDRGVADETLAKAVDSVVAAICPCLKMRDIRISDESALVVVLDCRDQDGALVAPRHSPLETLDGLKAIGGEAVRTQRLREIAYRISVALSEILQLIHSRRNNVALAFLLTTDEASQPTFGLTFKATQLFVYRKTILAALNERRLPDLPICKNLYLKGADQ